MNFRYRRMAAEARERLVDALRRALRDAEGVVFAYLHGGFVEREAFRDIDVAVWVERPEDAFKYEVELSARLEAKLGIPVDLHVLNHAPLPLKHRNPAVYYFRLKGCDSKSRP